LRDDRVVVGAALSVRLFIAVAPALAKPRAVVGERLWFGRLDAVRAAGTCGGESCQHQHCEYAHENLLVVLLKFIVAGGHLHGPPTSSLFRLTWTQCAACTASFLAFAAATAAS